MDLVEKLPQMTDDALQTLATNARRLANGSGTPAQKSDAETVLPAIDAELASRRVAKLAKARADSAAARKVGKTTKTAKTKKSA
jgi:hypothetical protein